MQNYSATHAQLKILMLIRRRRSSPCGVTCNLLKKNKYKILYRLIDDIYFNTELFHSPYINFNQILESHVYIDVKSLLKYNNTYL